MSRPAPVDVDHYQGDELDFVLRLRASDDLPPVYRDLTGKVGKAQVRKKAGDAVLLADLEVTVLDQETDLGRGSLRVFCASSVMESVPAGKWVWDLQLTNADGSGKKTVAAGAFTVDAQVTTQ